MLRRSTDLRLSRWPKLVLVLLLGAWVSGCDGDSRSDATPVQERAVALAVGDSVRFVEAGTDAWILGVVGMLGECVVFMKTVPSPDGHAYGRAIPVRIEKIQRVQVHPVAGDGDAASTPSPTSHAGWHEIPIDELVTRHGGCQPWS